MAYTHLTMKELSWIETYFDIGLKPYKIARKIGRSNQPVYNVVSFLKESGSFIGYFDQYKQNKSKCGAKKKTFTKKQTQFIKDKVSEGQTPSRKAEDIEWTLINWFKQLPKNIFKLITFDCGKEFSNWKNLSNQQDISIFFADPGCPSQRGLNEHSNGLLRKGGLPKQMDFNEVDQQFISSVAIRRNKIPRKSLNYKTPLEAFLENVSGLNYIQLNLTSEIL